MGRKASYSLNRLSESKPKAVESVSYCPRVVGLVAKSRGTWKAVNCNNKSQSGNSVSKTASTNFHQFTIRSKQVATICLLGPLMSPSVFGRPPDTTIRGLRIRANMC